MLHMHLVTSFTKRRRRMTGHMRAPTINQTIHDDKS
jgi:hypothetical protein